MSRAWRTPAATLFGLLAATQVAAQVATEQPIAGIPAVDAGRTAYTTYCTRCHGVNLQVGSSAFFDLRTFPSDDKERFLRSVLKGKRVMPAWEGIVKPSDIESIWLYIGSVNNWPPTSVVSQPK